MWISLPRLVGALAPLPILLACASGGGRDANVITAPELSHSSARNVYDAIRQIRPELLRTRDPGSVIYFKARRPLVAVDNTLVGDVELLRHLPTGRVARIQYVDPWVAARTYGVAGRTGIMFIETRPDSEPEIAAGTSASR
jgi:hypothetical protein